MNKDVIYLEPEDDITDILTKLQGARQKLVALVPPKKTTLLRSAVNMKLVAKAARESEKVAVIVTADPAIVKQAMLAEIPVAKNLQSRPVVPTKESLASHIEEDDLISEDLSDSEASEKAENQRSAKGKMPGEAASGASERSKGKSRNTIDLTEESLENGSEKGKKPAKSDKKASSGPKTAFEKYRKWIIIGAIAAVLLIVVGVWAFVFAPAVKITVAMNTSSNNFSENVSFTTDRAAADPASGKFYAEKQTFEQKFTSNFTATGEEDRGDKASGNLSVTFTFSIQSYIGKGFTASVASGAQFTAENGKVYVATTSANKSWDGNTMPIACDSGSVSQLNSNCSMTLTIPVVAAAPGADYNLEKSASWNGFQGASVTNPAALTGGTSKPVKLVTAENIKAAEEQIMNEHQVDGRDQLFKQVRDDSMITIESSFASEAGEVKSKPEVNGVVEDGVTPELAVTVVYSVYTIEKTAVEEFVNSKTTLGPDQKIYSVSDPYFERFTSIEEPARLKAVVKTGPTVTEEDILERTKGRKTGEVQTLLRSINGVSSVTITPSYFWVRSVPTDPSKVTIELTVEDR